MTEVTLIILGIGVVVAIGAVLRLGKRLTEVEDEARLIKTSMAAEHARDHADHSHDGLAGLKAGEPVPAEFAPLIPAGTWTLALALDADCAFCRGTVERWKDLAEEAGPAHAMVITDVWPAEDPAWARLPEDAGVRLGPGALATIPTPAAAIISPDGTVVAAGPVESSYELDVIVSEVSELAATAGKGASG
ncbi:hypothetical protein SMC26_27070 [Actinomadura fulvescens]|uniref:Thioredoxin domain-containing protein n=1 Tax=Actinomadura fulvescens TaxID=46160 RepID=A0ABN3PHW3_9ACTN